MNDTLFNVVVHTALATVKKNTPYKTGNLRNKATMLKSKGGRTFVIYVDTATAPYFKYVNGTRSGKSVRSTGYWKKAAYAAANDIAAFLGGRIE